jgi:hypothetical protein
MKTLKLITLVSMIAFVSNAQNTDSLNYYNPLINEQSGSEGIMESLTTLTCTDAVARWLNYTNSTTGEDDLLMCEIGSVGIGFDPNSTILPQGRLHTIATASTNVRRNLLFERETISDKFTTQISINASSYSILNTSLATDMSKGFNLQSNGNLGIGTYVPEHKLDVAGGVRTILGGTNSSVAVFGSSSTKLMRMVTELGTSAYNPMSTANDQGIFWSDGGAGGNQNNTAGFLIGPHTGTAARGIKIKSDGNVGIGVANPAQKLDVAGSILSSSLAGTGNRMVIANSSGVLSAQAQPTLSIVGTSLSISNGNSVTIPGDNLGNHTATQNLNMNTKEILSLFKLNFHDGTVQDVASPWRKATNNYFTDERVKLGGSGSGTSTNWRFEVLDGASRFSGNVGIKTSSPNTFDLDVIGDAGKSSGGTSWQSLSDARLKNVSGDISNSLEIISQLHPIKYTWNEDKIKRYGPDPGQKFGFLAQELRKIIPEFVTEDKEGTLWYNPSGIEAILVAAIKEQQQLIDKYYNELQEIKNCCSSINSFDNFLQTQKQEEQVSDISSGINNQHLTSAKLYQNKPNPFNNQTVIEYEINMDYTDAVILIFDMQGKQLKKISGLSKGKGSVIINSNELYAGMFMYSLIIGGKEIDTKRMILNN